MTINGRSLDLWIDGNNSTATSWQNLAPAAFSLERGQSGAITVQNSNNFHREIFFGGTATNAKLRTTANYNIEPGRAYYAFVVVSSHPGSAGRHVLLSYNPGTSDANAERTSLHWSNNNIRAGWGSTSAPATLHALNPPNTQLHGIASMNIMNGGAGTVFMNGRGSNFTAASLTVTGSRLYIANGNTNMTSGLATGRNLKFGGSIQEIIVMNGDEQLSDTDIQRIHSYLAIKYGLTLENTADNFLDSDGNVIWNRTVNDGFNHHIFGIGRDNATRLNQVQNRHHDSHILTLFKGNRVETLNNNNSTAFAVDKTYLMLGSNNQSINADVSYSHFEGTVFANTPAIDFKFNYRTELVYKAQLTRAGVSSANEMVNIQIQSARPRFVLVSADPTFLPSATRIYPIVDRIAMEVVINDGDYISFGGFEITPGGVIGSYILDLWVDGNNSTNTSWQNLASATHSLERFATNTPVVQNSRFNFHREIHFGNALSSKLRTAENYQILAGQAYYAFVVSENPDAGERVLLSYNPATSDANARRTSLQWNGTNIRVGWNTTTIPAANSVTNTQRHGIASMNVMNGGAGTVYMNGTAANFTAGLHPAITNRLHIGNGNNTTGTATHLQFDGSMQEIIVMRGNAQMSVDDIAKIHTYLAIKYGIHLNAGDYLASDGTILWDRHAGYDQHVFGIGRDDFSGLNQRQALSASDNRLTIFVGERLAMLNSENTARLNDMQFLLIGSNGADVSPLPEYIQDGDVFQNGTIAAPEDFNIQSAVYKAQLTETNSMNVKTVISSDFLYALVSDSDDFIPDNTRIYPRVGNVIEIELTNEYRYFKYVGFSPGPGGITAGLAMWLRADDASSLGINNIEAAGNSLLAGYPFSIADRENVSAVHTWSDAARGHTFTRRGARTPVFERNDPEMNFQPSVRFWTNGSNVNTAFLGNSSGIMSQARPEHTAIFVLNNDFGGGVDFVHALMFGTATIGGYSGPGYGVVRERGNAGVASTDGRGRFRYSGAAGSGATAVVNSGGTIFDAGATTIAGYNVAPRTGANASSVRFRFNGMEDTRSFTLGSGFDMRLPSTLGAGGTNFERTLIGSISEAIMFDRILNEDELRQVESYLAFKYGITLRPTTVATRRFDYTLSNGHIVWQGNIDDREHRYVKYYYNIAGVLRDDMARLNIQQSHSTDLGSIMYMGVAGTQLTVCGNYLGHLEHDLEAIVWGNDNATGFTQMNPEDCGDFEYRFNRIWYVNKHTQDGRPLSMLVSARGQNAGLQFGMLAGDRVKEYYRELGAQNDLFLLVADSPEDIQNGIFRSVIPMNFIEGNHQVAYIFTEEHTYVTFGYKPNTSGCVGDPEHRFTGQKRFLWTHWTSRINRNASSRVGFTVPDTPGMGANLGDGIHVVSTSVEYPGGLYTATGTAVRGQFGFPRSVNRPERGSLEVRRRGGQPRNENSDVIITIRFNTPVVPEFTISGLDGDSRSWETVSITGHCVATIENANGTTTNQPITVSPVLNFVSNPNTSSYIIQGNRATVRRRGFVAPTNRNGRVHVAFESGVTEIRIRYGTINQRSTFVQSINISPITVRDVVSLPPANEDGLAFLKRERNSELSTCERAEYTFFIQNTNCENKYLNFRDELPEFMMWESFTLDTTNVLHNPNIRINNYEGNRVIKIDSLLLPASTTIRLLATAAFEENAPTGYYTNQAVISYDRISYAPGDLTAIVTREELTSDATIYAEHSERMEEAKMTIASNRSNYRENDIIEFTVTVTNPNVDISDSFLDFNFNGEFTFITNSLTITDGDKNPLTTDFVVVPPFTDESGYFTIAGTTETVGGEIEAGEGFVLPAGVTVIKFKLQAPAQENLELELDNNGNLIAGKVISLELSSIFFSDAIDDPCFARAVESLEKSIIVPYRAAVPTRIVTNRHITTRLLRKR